MTTIRDLSKHMLWNGDTTSGSSSPLIDYNTAYLLSPMSSSLFPKTPRNPDQDVDWSYAAKALPGLVFEAEQDGLQPNVEAEVTKSDRR